MNLSFYSAAVGANAHQEKLNVIANNMANINTNGYKAQSAIFADLLYNNMSVQEGDEETNLKNGCGTRVEKTDILFTQGPMEQTDKPYDYAILGEGFFCLFNPVTEEVTYTRNGNFTKSMFEEGQFFLVTDNGRQVLNRDMEPIELSAETDATDEVLDIGVYVFDNQEGFICRGTNEYLPVAKNGAILVNDDVILKKGYLEGANVDLSLEMSRVIETQRAYQLSLKMVQTSDEIEQTINSLR